MSKNWWYLSFADSECFLGAVIIQGINITDAALSAHYLGINPGGSVMGFEIPDIDTAPPFPREKLLSRAELEQFDELVKI